MRVRFCSGADFSSAPASLRILNEHVKLIITMSSCEVLPFRAETLTCRNVSRVADSGSSAGFQIKPKQTGLTCKHLIPFRTSLCRQKTRAARLFMKYARHEGWDLNS